MSARAVGALLHHPQPAVEQALAAVVAQADQLVARHRQRARRNRGARACAHCRRGAWRCGRPAPGRRRARACGSRSARRTTWVSPYWPVASAWPARMSIDSRTIGLSCAWRCTSVSMASGSASVKKPPPWIGGSCAGSPSTSSGTPNDIRSRAELGVDHRAFVDDDQLRLRGRRVVPQLEARLLLAALARAVDQAVDGGGAGAALAAHHQAALPVKAANSTLPSTPSAMCLASVVLPVPA